MKNSDLQTVNIISLMCVNIIAFFEPNMLHLVLVISVPFQMLPVIGGRSQVVHQSIHIL